MDHFPVKILVVDNATILRNRFCEKITELFPDQFRCFQADSRESAWRIMTRENGIDVVCLETDFPGMDGPGLCEEIRKRYSHVILILLTKHDDLNQLGREYENYDIRYVLRKPWKNFQIELAGKMILQLVGAARQNFELRKEAESQLYRKLNMISDIFVEISPKLYEIARDVTGLTNKVGDMLDLSATEKTTLEIASSLYLIGLLKIPDKFLATHPRQLYGDARVYYASYHERSAKMIKSTPEFVEACPIVMAHRENLDGSGPLSLVEETIPIGAKILRVCDHYQKSVELWGQRPKETVQSMNRQAKDKFCQTCIAALLKVLTARMGSVVVPIKLEDLKVGMKVGGDVHAGSGRLLLPEQSIITDITLKRLQLYNELDPIEEIPIVSSSGVTDL